MCVGLASHLRSQSPSKVCQTCLLYNVYVLMVSLVTGGSLAAKVTSANLRSQSPSEVCQTCLQKYTDGAIWLAWLECIHPEEHIRDPTKTVVVSSSLTKLITVRSLPCKISHLDPHHLSYCQNYPACKWGSQCSCSHSEEELNYWKWQSVSRMYMELVSV